MFACVCIVLISVRVATSSCAGLSTLSTFLFCGVGAFSRQRGSPVVGPNRNHGKNRNEVKGINKKNKRISLVTPDPRFYGRLPGSFSCSGQAHQSVEDFQLFYFPFQVSWCPRDVFLQTRCFFSLSDHSFVGMHSPYLCKICERHLDDPLDALGVGPLSKIVRILRKRSPHTVKTPTGPSVSSP